MHLSSSQLVSEELQQLVKVLQDHVDGRSDFKPDGTIVEGLRESLDAVESIYQCGLSQSRICDDVLSLGKLQMSKWSWPAQTQYEADIFTRQTNYPFSCLVSVAISQAFRGLTNWCGI